MPLTPPIPIPPGLDLCHAWGDINLFTQLVNYNFGLIVQGVQSSLSQSITLPGIESVDFASQGLDIPGLGAFNYRIEDDRPQIDGAYIGGRYPTGSDAASESAYGGVSGTSGASSLGSLVTAHGVDPRIVLFEMINMNYQALIDQVPSLANVIVKIPVPLVSPCKPPNQPGAAAAAAGIAIINIINNNNSSAQSALSGSAIPQCIPQVPSAVFQTGGHRFGCWVTLQNATTNFTVTTTPPYTFDYNCTLSTGGAPVEMYNQCNQGVTDQGRICSDDLFSIPCTCPCPFTSKYPLADTSIATADITLIADPSGAPGATVVGLGGWQQPCPTQSSFSLRGAATFRAVLRSEFPSIGSTIHVTGSMSQVIAPFLGVPYNSTVVSLQFPSRTGLHVRIDNLTYGMA